MSDWPSVSHSVGDPAVGPPLAALTGAVMWIPEPKGFDSLLRVNGPVGRFLKNKAEQCQMMARSMAPVDTGDLRDSIFVRYGKDGNNIFAEIGTDIFYGPFQEFGTSRNPPHPYLRPALAATMSDLGPGAVWAGGNIGAEFEGPGDRFSWDSDAREWG